MDELRIEIWDLLYRAKEPKSIDEIAQLTGQETESVRAAVQCDWFTVEQDQVTIARGGGDST